MPKPKKNNEKLSQKIQKNQKHKKGSPGSKSRKKKWSKRQLRERLNNSALFDKVTYERLYKEIPSFKLITPFVAADKLKITASLARCALVELERKGLIRQVVKHHSCIVYTGLVKEKSDVCTSKKRK